MDDSSFPAAGFALRRPLCLWRRMGKTGEFLKAFEAVFSRAELKRLAWLGIPVFITHLAQMGMNFADIVMTGWAGPGEMAAVGVACSIWNPLSLFCWGCLLPQTPLKLD